MSRIGKNPIEIPPKVQVSIIDGLLTAKGPNGELSVSIPDVIEHKIENNVLTFSRVNEEKSSKAIHGLTRSLASNAIEGVSKGFTKTLKFEGVGYKVEQLGEKLMFRLGYSHPILILPPDGISFEVPKTPLNTIYVKGADKQLVGEIAARIRKLRPPEPYKGKGLRYEGEYIRRKAGKASA